MVVYNEHMFDTDIDTTGLTADQVEQLLLRLEAEIATLRAAQLRMVRRADLMQLAGVDGARSLTEWIAGRLDVAPETARDLVHAARTIPDDTETELEAGLVSFDRAVATSRLAAAGAPDHVVAMSGGYDIVGVRRLAAAHRRMEPGDEREVFDSRHATVQLSLDQTSANLWAQLTGVDSQVVTEALHEWADRLPDLPDGSRDTLAHRQADALVAICRHALGTDPESGDSRGPQVLLTADLDTLAESGGTAGATVVGGPRIGLQALEEALCNGSVSLDVTCLDGTVLGIGSDADVIPPRVRRHILARDNACTADACPSRYRLQVHHIRPRSRGGGHDPANLTTLCWYHHHVVVHGRGYQIDPDSPAHRRRFTPPGADPPRRE